GAAGARSGERRHVAAAERGERGKPRREERVDPGIGRADADTVEEDEDDAVRPAHRAAGARAGGRERSLPAIPPDADPWSPGPGCAPCPPGRGARPGCVAPPSDTPRGRLPEAPSAARGARSRPRGSSWSPSSH